MGEIKFTAETASSTAKLKVKGKLIAQTIHIMFKFVNRYVTMFRCGCKQIWNLYESSWKGVGKLQRNADEHLKTSVVLIFWTIRLMWNNYVYCISMYSVCIRPNNPNLDWFILNNQFIQCNNLTTFQSGEGENLVCSSLWHCYASLRPDGKGNATHLEFYCFHLLFFLGISWYWCFFGGGLLGSLEVLLQLLCP